MIKDFQKGKGIMKAIYIQKIIKRLAYMTVSMLVIAAIFNRNHLEAYAATGETFVDKMGILYEITSVASAERNGTVNVIKNYDNECEGNILIPDTVTEDGYTYQVTTIDDIAFFKCNITSMTIPKSVTFIGGGAFASCKSLMAITVDSDNPVYVSDDGILYDKNKTTLLACPAGRSRDVVIPTSVTVIGNSAFCGCSGLSHIVINGNSLTSIDDFAFESCTNLVDIILPESLTTIGEIAFVECNSLTSVTIPKNVTSIADNIFESCKKLTEINVADGNPAYIDEGGILYDKNKTNLISCPSGKTGVVMIPTGVTHIDFNSFFECENITNIILPNSVKSIGFGAFSYCSKLNNITLPNNVTSIDGFAFSDCKELSSISIPNRVKIINAYTFYGCSNLTSIKLPDSIKAIGNSSFQDCSKLSNIIIPKNVTAIGEYAFNSCYNLTSVTLNKRLKKIGILAFSGCSFNRITIPESVNLIEDSAFSYNYSDRLSVIFKGKTPPIISSNPFNNCNQLSISVPYSALSKYKLLFKELGINGKIKTSGNSTLVARKSV